MEKMIDPNKLTVENCLRTKKYYIDFYQREYVWRQETVYTLLKDIFWAFENSYELHRQSELTAEIMAKYNWYYLNVFITNNVDGKTYIVDGQQRLSTLTLIAAYLYHRIENENIKDVLKDCIFSADRYTGKIYNIDHEKRKRIMEMIFKDDGNIIPNSFENATEKTLWDRYQDIKSYFEQQAFSSEKLLVFSHYFLERLVLVELAIEKDDTPMVFEVINDRGEPLKQFEILKGKLIGTLSKDDTETYSSIWDESISLLPSIEDNFFVDYLKAKFIHTTNSSLLQTITNSFHRYIFEADNDISNTLAFRRQDEKSVENIKRFIASDVAYYTKLYKKIRSNEDEFLSYDNNINELFGQYQNILAACDINDTSETDKIKAIAYEYDRMNMLLRLNGIYDSNDLQDLVYRLNKKLPGKTVTEYRNIFNALILEELRTKTGKENIDSLLEYERFATRGYENMPTRSLRYFFARVEKYLCDNLGMSMSFSVYDISKKTGSVYGFHIEHILSRNEESRSMFESDEEFESMRNRLGGLLLLRGKDNISSGNEIYTEKLRTYSNGLEWGRTLISDTYHTNTRLKDFNKAFFEKNGRKFEPINTFDKEALEKRSRLLYAIVKEIWDV